MGQRKGFGEREVVGESIQAKRDSKVAAEHKLDSKEDEGKAHSKRKRY